VTRSASILIVPAVFVAAILAVPTAARGQAPATDSLASTPSTATPAAQTASDDDHEKLRLAEPDYFVINIPTTLPLPEHKGNFHLTHRFAGNLRQGSFGDNLGSLFGLDNGATISFEYRFGITKHLEAIAARTNFDRTIQFSAKYDALHQNAASPVGVSALVSVEGGNNFRRDRAPALGLSVSRTIGEVAALYADPLWVNNSAPGTGLTRNTFVVGLGARVRVMPTTYLSVEVSPRVTGYVPGDAEYAFSLDKRVGGHFFQLVFSNATGTTFGQLARGGFPQSLFLGFNLTRKFF
jgi:hypothetical protein